MCSLCDGRLYAGDEVVRTGSTADGIAYAHLECIPVVIYDDDVTRYIGHTPKPATTDPVRAALAERFRQDAERAWEAKTESGNR